MYLGLIERLAEKDHIGSQRLYRRHLAGIASFRHHDDGLDSQNRPGIRYGLSVVSRRCRYHASPSVFITKVMHRIDASPGFERTQGVVVFMFQVNLSV